MKSALYHINRASCYLKPFIKADLKPPLWKNISSFTIPKSKKDVRDKVPTTDDNNMDNIRNMQNMQNMRNMRNMRNIRNNETNNENNRKTPPPCKACANCLVTLNHVTNKREYKCALIVNSYDIITGEIDYVSSKKMREEGICRPEGIFFVPQNFFQRCHFKWRHLVTSDYVREMAAILLVVFYLLFLLFGIGTWGV